jgi:hypothetical protein
MAIRTGYALASLVIGVGLACSRGPSRGTHPAGPGSEALGRSGSAGSTGGTAGAGGSGGSAGSTGAAPADAAGGLDSGSSGWPGSEDAWQRLDVPGCELFAATKEKLPLLTREWTACGSGCLSAPAVPSIGVVAGPAHRRPFAASFPDGKTVHLRAVADVIVAGKGATMWLSTSEPEGILHGALLSPGSGCSSSGAFANHADVLHVRTSERHVVGRAASLADFSASNWTAYAGVNTTGASSAAGWGMALISGEVMFKSWTSATPVRITSDETYSLSLVSDALVWVGYQGKPRAGLWASRPGAAPRSLWSSELSALQVAVTPDRHVVWLAASGPSAREGLYENAYWYDAVLTDALELTAIRQGPELPVSAGILALVAGDAFAATEGCTQDAGAADQCPVLVFNWETRQTWTLHERPDRYLTRPLAINRERLVLTENKSNNADSTAYVEGIVLLATSELTRVETGW